MNKAEVLELVEYELASSWWAGFVTWPWLQEKLADRTISKVKRKLRNFEKFRHLRALRERGATRGHIMWAIRQQRLKERP